MAKQLYQYIEKTGVVLPDTELLREGVEAEFKQSFGQDLVITPESPEGVLITVETEARDTVLRTNATLANMINPNLAGGTFLDAICKLTGLERTGAEQTLVKALLRGVPSTIIPAGVKAKTNEGNVFYSKTATILNDSGKATVYFYSEEYAAIPCPTESLTKIETMILGWESITNEAPATLGRCEQTDVNLRELRKNTLFLQGVALSGAIQSAVYALPYVRSLVYRENYTNTFKEIDGITLNPHSVYLCVDGGEDEAIAEAIFTHKSGGCGYTGRDVTVDVLEPISGIKYPVIFDRPKPVNFRARLTVKDLGGANIDIESGIKKAVVTYANGGLAEALLEKNPESTFDLSAVVGLTVGTAVSPFEISGAVMALYPQLFIANCEVGLLSSSASDLKSETLTIKPNEKAEISLASVDVVKA